MKQYKAVITGDLIGSKNLGPELRSYVFENLNELIVQLTEEDNVFSMYRGDSIQGLIARPDQALDIAMKIKTCVKRSSLIPADRYPRKPKGDIRLSIGIGEVEYKRKNIEESDGSAFQYSGRRLDKMKEDKITMALTTEHSSLNTDWNVIFGLLDSIMFRWTISSAELVYELLNGKKEQEISEHLGISQPAVNQRKRHASWDAIKPMLSLFNEDVNKYYG